MTPPRRATPPSAPPNGGPPGAGEVGPADLRPPPADVKDMADPADVFRLYETLVGRGVVYDGAQRIAETAYQLRDVEELVYDPAVDPGERRAAVPGARSIYGLLRSPQAEALSQYVGLPLVLELQDGRRFRFTVAKAQRAGARLDAVLIRSLDLPR